MCGIAGIYCLKKSEPVGAIVRNMLARIKYRGPDETGIYVNKNVGLGSVRLSIIDLVTGQQPLSDESGRYWIVFNGEIFNYPELRNDLINQNVKFKTKSDTEVILQLYIKHGEDCLSKLNGQFAFSIYDHTTGQLFLGRDRIGIRPLYYTFSDGNFTFASEIKAIFENRNIRPEFSYRALLQVTSFWVTVPPATPFEGINELPPGHFMVLSRNGSFTIKKYWEIDFSDPFDKESMGIEKALEGFEEIFSDAVKIRLRADVPVAAYLSGGLDSSLTSGSIKNTVSGILNTFSVGFANINFDESKYQKEMVDYLGTTNYSITCTEKEIAENFPMVVWHSEMPLLRTAPVPLYLLSKLVREKNIKVVITGEGADEILAGYNIFKENEIRRFWSKYPGSKYRPLLLNKLYPYMAQFKSVNSQMRRFFYSYKLEETENPFYSHLIRWNNTSRISYLFGREIYEISQSFNPFDELKHIVPENINNWSSLAKAQWIEMKLFLSGYLLSSQGDRVSMANSVEGRYPFLDYRLIEYCSKLPANYKLNGLNEKYLLKKFSRGKIPESILNRPKQAYRAPFEGCFFGKDKPLFVEEMFSKETISDYGIFNYDSVGGLINKIENSQFESEVDNMAFVYILSTQLLYNFFIKDRKPLKQEIEINKLVTQD